MTTKAQKRTINLALKVAIVQSGKSSRIVALRSGIGEVRLSAFGIYRYDEVFLPILKQVAERRANQS